MGAYGSYSFFLFFSLINIIYGSAYLCISRTHPSQLTALVIILIISAANGSIVSTEALCKAVLNKPAGIHNPGNEVTELFKIVKKTRP